VADWWSIEVMDGQSSAALWWETRRDVLIEAAIAHGAKDWELHRHRWGVLLELCFAEEADWEAFYGLPAVQAALDAVPDPLAGLLVHRGRGGSSGIRSPRRPTPLAGAGAAALPEPSGPEYADLRATETTLAGPRR
jgi:hypothetical protein